jgi:hypothetical protein
MRSHGFFADYIGLILYGFRRKWALFMPWYECHKTGGGVAPRSLPDALLTNHFMSRLLLLLPQGQHVFPPAGAQSIWLRHLFFASSVGDCRLARFAW